MSKKDKKKDAKKALKKAEKAAAKKAKRQEKAVEAAEAVPAVEEPPAPAKAAAPKAIYTPVEGEPLKTISVKMPVSLAEAADVAAKNFGDEGVSRSEFIRTAIERLINQG